jgi:hypothetical protein
MKTLALGRFMFGAGVAAVFFAGCAGSQPAVGVPTGLSAAAMSRSGSWMLPQARNQDLVYVALLGIGDIRVFTYAGEEVGRLHGPGEGFDGLEEGLCSNESGDVLITDPGISKVLEYRHGGQQPVKALNDNDIPLSCSVDPVTGNVAVLDDKPRNVAIFKPGSGVPTVYPLFASVRFLHCSYDGAGNLFVAGSGGVEAGKRKFFYMELPAGASSFKQILLRAHIKFAGGIQWDGRYIVISDGDHKLYRTVGARVVGTTTVQGGTLSAFWIQRDRLLDADGYPQRVQFWGYPGGGRSTGQFSVKYEPLDVTVSVAPAR